MTASKRLTTTGHGNPVREVGGVIPDSPYRAAGDFSDVRRGKGITITPLGFGAGDEFKLRVWSNAYVGRGSSGPETGTPYVDTIAFTHGTDALKSDLQTALRTATGDTGLLVGGTDSDGPFTITAGAEASIPFMQAVAITGDAAIQIEDTAITYVDATGHPATANQTPSFPGTSGLVGSFWPTPLGYSSQNTDGTALLPPTIASIATDATTATFADTEVAGGGSVFYSAFETATNTPVGEVAVDSNGDGVITGLTASTDYVVYAFTQTAGGRVSRPSKPIYITTTA
jgi:hypothetical protein